MKRNKTLQSPRTVHDYSPALQDALSWLGDRHLLAQPVVRMPEQRRAWFAETPRWMPPTRH
jgi:hypothetical protein